MKCLGEAIFAHCLYVVRQAVGTVLLQGKTPFRAVLTSLSCLPNRETACNIANFTLKKLTGDAGDHYRLLELPGEMNRPLTESESLTKRFNCVELR